MKYLVVSDNHSDREILNTLFTQYRGNVDAIFHCGDSELDSDDPLWVGVHKVRGNCDFDTGYPEELVINTGEDVVYMTHGHLVDVKTSMLPITLKAKEVGANIILFGHTHVLGVEKHEGILYLNPGSILLPRGQYRHVPTYAIIESNTHQFSIQYYNRQQKQVSELAFTFTK